ncbi:MAG: hypothetical protein NDI69_04405 [Bacteriovoracaceae bacterium]|nr:hypothetical protein [Bacteriovoracaceae bacterium]
MIGSIIPHQHVYIYGAGFAGLSLGHQLKKLGIPFTIYEKEKVGGKISTRMTAFGPIEAAASTLYMNAHAEEFIKEMEIPYLNSEKKLKRWIWRKEKLLSPLNFKLALKLLFKAAIRVPSITENSSVEDIFLPLLGRRYVDELLSPALQGIHAAEARDLHFLSLFPFAQNRSYASYFSFFKSLKKEMKKHAAVGIKGSVSFPGGMQSLINKLHEEVSSHIEPLPETFVLRPNTVICTSAPDAAKLLEKVLPEISLKLKEIEYRPISNLSFYLKEELPSLKKSFGMLIPQKYGSPILGIIHQSAVFPSNYSNHCYSVICKGITSEDEIFQELKTKVPGFQKDNILVHSLTAWKTGLPLYDEKRFQTVEKLKQLLKDKPGLMFFGNYTEGISLRSMIEQTRKL